MKKVNMQSYVAKPPVSFLHAHTHTHIHTPMHTHTHNTQTSCTQTTLLTNRPLSVIARVHNIRRELSLLILRTLGCSISVNTHSAMVW